MSSNIDFCPDMADPLSVCGGPDYKHGLEINCLTKSDHLQGCNLQIFKENLLADAPVALCIGECGKSVHAAGVQTVQLTFSSKEGAISPLIDYVSNVFQDIFKIAKDTGSKGVYLVGFGFGAFLAAKLLSDRQFFKEITSLNLFQAAYLISGMYNVKKENIDAVMSPGSPTEITKLPGCGQSPQSVPKKSPLIDSLIMDRQSFEDRKNLSFVCELSDKSPTFYGDVYRSDSRKFKQDHGLHINVNPPIYQTTIADKDNQIKSETVLSSTSLDDLDLFKLLSEESDDISPLNDNFMHLCPMGIRLYVFAGDKDSYIIQKQSRAMYDCISTGCHTGNMHFQIKDKLDRHDMKVLFTNEDNFLKRLIRFDIVKNI